MIIRIRQAHNHIPFPSAQVTKGCLLTMVAFCVRSVDHQNHILAGRVCHFHSTLKHWQNFQRTALSFHVDYSLEVVGKVDHNVAWFKVMNDKVLHENNKLPFLEEASKPIRGTEGCDDNWNKISMQ